MFCNIIRDCECNLKEVITFESNKLINIHEIYANRKIAIVRKSPFEHLNNQYINDKIEISERALMTNCDPLFP